MPTFGEVLTAPSFPAVMGAASDTTAVAVADLNGDYYLGEHLTFLQCLGQDQMHQQLSHFHGEAIEGDRWGIRNWQAARATDVLGRWKHKVASFFNVTPLWLDLDEARNFCDEDTFEFVKENRDHLLDPECFTPMDDDEEEENNVENNDEQ